MQTKGVNIFIILLIILLLISAGLGYYFYSENQDLKVEVSTSKQNTAALNSTIEETRNILGELEYSKSVVVGEKEQLISLSETLSNELDKERFKVSELTKTNIQLKGELGQMESWVSENGNIINSDSVFKINWKFDKVYDEENSRHIAGYTTFKFNNKEYQVFNQKSFLTRDYIRMSLVQGLRERNGLVEVFARSKYEGFAIDGMQSAIIDPTNHPVISKFSNTEKQRFNFGAYFGYGVTYNFKNREALDGIQIGLGINYIFF